MGQALAIGYLPDRCGCSQVTAEAGERLSVSSCRSRLAPGSPRSKGLHAAICGPGPFGVNTYTKPRITSLWHDCVECGPAPGELSGTSPRCVRHAGQTDCEVEIHPALDLPFVPMLASLLEETRFIAGGDEVELVLCSDTPVVLPGKGRDDCRFPSADAPASARETRDPEVTCRSLVSDAQELATPKDVFIEFRARVVYASAVAGPQVAVTVFGNEDVIITENVLLDMAFRYFRFRWDLPEPLWAVGFSLPASGCSAADSLLDAQPPLALGVDLDTNFGLRLRGEDLLPLLRAEAADHKERQAQWQLRGASRQAAREAARHGCLSLAALAPSRYIAEACIEFVAFGLDGREVLDVYVNGFTVPCQLGISLDVPNQPRLLRFTLAPASCTIVSLVVALSRRVEDGQGNPNGVARTSAREFGVIVDSDFGVIVAGQNCLPSAMLMPRGGGEGDVQISEKAQSGRWLWEGYYVLLPYRRKKKPYDRSLDASECPVPTVTRGPPPSMWAEVPAAPCAKVEPVVVWSNARDDSYVAV